MIFFDHKPISQAKSKMKPKFAVPVHHDLQNKNFGTNKNFATDERKLKEAASKDEEPRRCSEPNCSWCPSPGRDTNQNSEDKQDGQKKSSICAIL